MTRKFFALFLATLLPAAANAGVVWKGDFSTGDLSQWSTQMVSPDRLQVIPGGDNPSGSKYAVRALVKQGDNPINASGNRNEVVHPVYTQEGQEYYYRWQVKFDPSFPSENTWQLFTQLHQKADFGGSPPIQFYVQGEEIKLTLSTAENLVWAVPLERGKWLDFVMHVKFSDDPKKGFLELWYNGQYVMEKTYGVTMAEDYLKLGLYRNADIKEDGIVYHTGMVQGETLADVMPPQTTSTSGGSGSTSSSHSGGSTSGAPATSHTSPTSSTPSTGGCSSAGGPATLGALAVALGGLALLRRRRSRRNA